jgi:hypothetical protein
MRLMAGGDFPFPLLGLVHLDNSITRHRAIGAGERLDLAVRAEDLRPHPKGKAFSLIAEARVGDELVWEERGTILRRGGENPDAARDPRPAPVPEDAQLTNQWKLGDDLGRRYAGVSGDRNPIHMHSLSAKAFGFPRAIAHGRVRVRDHRRSIGIEGLGEQQLGIEPGGLRAGLPEPGDAGFEQLADRCHVARLSPARRSRRGPRGARPGRW